MIDIKMDCQKVWNELRKGKKVLLSNQEIDILQSYINTLEETEQDIYYRQFASLYVKGLELGLLSRCYRCKLGNFIKNS